MGGRPKAATLFLLGMACGSGALLLPAPSSPVLMTHAIVVGAAQSGDRPQIAGDRLEHGRR